MTAEERAEEILQHGSALDAIRRPWDGLFQDLADVFNPGRNLIGTSIRTNSSPDTSKAAENFDSTAARANRTLAQGCSARITPMGAQWGALRPPDNRIKSQSAVRWYRQCGEILFRYMGVSNFYQGAHQHYLDRGAFGTAATEAVAGKNGKGLHYRAYSIGEYAIGTDDFDEVDAITRVFQRTPKQLKQLYGENALPEDVRKKLSDPKASIEPMQVRITIRPRIDRDPRKSDSRNKPWESLHVLVEGKHILSESGFDEFPIACSRWELWGDSPWGWGPSIVALPDANQLNFLEQMLDTLAEVAAFPRVLYNSSLKGDIDFRAMGLTCWDPTQGSEQSMPREWLTGGRYDIGKDRSVDKRRMIEEAMFVPLFNAISQLDRKATATEVRAIVSESRELFHPIFSGLTREFLVPTIRRSFNILLRQGAFPEPPPTVFQDGELGAFIDDPDVQFTSSMALALEQSQLGHFNDVVATLAPIAASDPGAFDWLDTDVLGPLFARYKGLPEEIIRDPEAIEAIKSARAQAQQAAAMQQMTGAVKNLGGAPGLQDLAGLVGA